jgi:hypothetical protein
VADAARILAPRCRPRPATVPLSGVPPPEQAESAQGGGWTRARRSSAVRRRSRSPRPGRLWRTRRTISTLRSSERAAKVRRRTRPRPIKPLIETAAPSRRTTWPAPSEGSGARENDYLRLSTPRILSMAANGRALCQDASPILLKPRRRWAVISVEQVN